MPVKPSDADIDELLEIANASNPAARRWLTDALAAARAIAEGNRKPRPSRSQHNASLDAIERSVDLSIKALTEFKRQLHSHYDVWGSAALGPASAHNLEDVPVVFVSALENIRNAAHNARRTGRPPNRRKQHIVDLGLAFCARFSNSVPTSYEKIFSGISPNNFTNWRPDCRYSTKVKVLTDKSERHWQGCQLKRCARHF